MQLFNALMFNKNISYYYLFVYIIIIIIVFFK